MDSALVSIAGTVQLIGLAILVVVVIILGARIAGTGARGFSSLIMELAGLLIAVWIIARPNDVTGILSKAVGGVQTPAAIGKTVAPAPTPVAQ